MTHRRQDWSLLDELGGPDALDAILTDLYARLYDDAMIGFFFLPHDRQRLVDHQRSYLLARLGRERTRYEGRSMRAAHAHLPILPGHFDRRHTILADTLEDHDVPAHVRRAWLDLDLTLREFILRQGTEARERQLFGDEGQG